MRSSAGLLTSLLLLSGAAVGWSAPAKKTAAPAKPGKVKQYGPGITPTVQALGSRIAPEDATSVKVLLIGAKDASTPTPNPPAVSAAAGDSFIVLHAEWETPDAAKTAIDGLASKDLKPFATFDRWADFYLATKNVEGEKALFASQGLKWVEVGRRVDVPPPPEAKEAKVRSNQESIVRGGISGLRGKGVIVAVVDSGIDFRHPDFITKDASGKPVSRIRALWDTVTPYEPGKPGQAAPISYPNGTSVGTVYTKSQLDAELQSNGTAIPPQDTNGHGTSCAGIAAGNGSALPDGRYTGVAPEAELIGVRIGPGPSLPNAYLLGAICDWLDTVAGPTPMVISCSFGGQYAGRDGNRIQERSVNARFPEGRKGRALVIAAGNEGANALHGEASFSDTPGVLTWNTSEGGKLDLYFDSADTKVNLSAPVETKLDPKLGKGHIYPPTGQLVWSINVPPGSGELRIKSTSGASRKVDAYLWGKGTATFTGDCLSFGKQIGTPGTIPNAITVGSYDWNSEFQSAKGTLILGDSIKSAGDGKPAPLQIGGLSSYSNPGYSRMEGVVKPEIVAPGQFHTSPAPLQPIPGKLRDVSGKYQPFNGTSAATPYVSGVLALVFEKKPAATLGEVRLLLQVNATSDRNTSTVPNSKWGFGKLNLEAVQRVIANTRP